MILFTVSLPAPAPRTELLSINMMDKKGTFNWVESSMMIFGWLFDLNPRIWMLKNSDANLSNLASVRNSLRGTFVA